MRFAAIQKLKTRFGDFWWWSLVIFLACRSGDLIQAFAGLWLVPKMVGEAELGAALPLIQISSVFALPLAILTAPFSRWLSIYSVRGELGKIKRLLSLAFWGVAIAFIIALALARFILPAFFERLRVAEGSLGTLLIVAGLAGPLASVFTSALQGLRRFGAITLSNIAGSPLRLLVLLIAMPFRPLSGYVLGQITPHATLIAIALTSLRRHLGRAVKVVKLGKSDVAAMLRYTWPIAINTLACSICGTWQALLIRQRLPEVESAAFYIISRLAETSSYAGISISLVLFPLVAEAHESGDRQGENALLRRIVAGTFIPGAAITIFFAFFGRHILGLVDLWSPYVYAAPLMTLLTLRTTLNAACGVCASYEIAAGRFAYLLFYLPMMIFETAALVLLTGYEALEPFMPQFVTRAVSALNPARLDFFIYWVLFIAIIEAVAFAIVYFLRSSKARSNPPTSARKENLP